MSDRADRLKERRQKTEGKIRERAETDEQSKPSKPDETDKPAQTDETDEPDETDESDETPVKDEQVGTYLYLPEGQRDKLRYQYKMLSAAYEREYGEDLEKNRHYYPLVVEYGLDRLDGCDAKDVKELLDGLEW